MAHDSLPDISILIVSWNTRSYLARCLRAVPGAAEKLNVEIIVVDNGSTDGTQAMLAEEFSRVRVIQNRENVGFGSANNIGAKTSRGRALLVLGSDCELGPGALAAMAREMDGDASLGAVLCRLLNPDGSLQPSVHQSLPSPWGLIGELLFLSSLRYAVYRHPALHPWLLRSTTRAHARTHDVAWGGGACMLVRRDLFLSLGGFDERFFMYREDMDLCKRIRDAGYRLRYLAEPSAVHHWGKSTAKLPERMLRESYNSRILYFDKHFPGWGGSVARWITESELGLCFLVFALLAFVPSRHQHVFRQKAITSVACLKNLPRPGPEETCPKKLRS